MIQIEYLNDKHYSDEGYFLLQSETGVKHLESIDIVPLSLYLY